MRIVEATSSEANIVWRMDGNFVCQGFDRVPLSQFSTAGSRSRRTAGWIVFCYSRVCKDSDWTSNGE